MESIGQLAAGIAHEINTPMQYIGDNINFLADSYDIILKLIYNFNAFLEDGNDYTNDEIREFYQNAKEELDLEFIFEEIPEAMEQTKAGVEKVTKSPVKTIISGFSLIMVSMASSMGLLSPQLPRWKSDI